MQRLPRRIIPLDQHTRKTKHDETADADAIPPVADLDLSFVNQVLYSSDMN